MRDPPLPPAPQSGSVYAIIFVTHLRVFLFDLWQVRDGPWGPARHFLSKAAAVSHAERLLAGRSGLVLKVTSTGPGRRGVAQGGPADAAPEAIHHRLPAFALDRPTASSRSRAGTSG